MMKRTTFFVVMALVIAAMLLLPALPAGAAGRAESAGRAAHGNGMSWGGNNGG